MLEKLKSLRESLREKLNHYPFSRVFIEATPSEEGLDGYAEMREINLKYFKVLKATFVDNQQVKELKRILPKTLKEFLATWPSEYLGGGRFYTIVGDEDYILNINGMIGTFTIFNEEIAIRATFPRFIEDPEDEAFLLYLDKFQLRGGNLIDFKGEFIEAGPNMAKEIEGVVKINGGWKEFVVRVPPWSVW